MGGFNLVVAGSVDLGPADDFAGRAAAVAPVGSGTDPAAATPADTSGVPPTVTPSTLSPSAAEPALTFWGAASAVSGSMHLFEAGRRRILLDCGLWQGKRDEARARNGRFPFHPDRIDAVVLSHAHLDHCGNLPTLVRHGFRGPVYCTPATRDLLRVMLRDSAKIQEEDAAHLNIRRNYAGPWAEPLYTHADVDRALGLVTGVPYHTETEPVPGVRFRFAEAGHILGSAAVHLTADAPDRPRTVTFTGDLGRRDVRFLRPPTPLGPADLVVCESTYGDRRHLAFDETVSRLYAAVRQAVYLGGKVLIPAFSLGRTQLIVHVLQQALLAKQIPAVPVYVDSPLAADIAEVYRGHPDELAPELAAAVREGRGVLGGDGVEYVRGFADSERLAAHPGPCVVVASGGMCDGGRVVHHLKRMVDDPRCVVVLVSYQAPGTTGRRLLEPGPTVRFSGQDWNKWATVVQLEGFSAHADCDEYLEAFAPLVGRVAKVCLIHGEKAQADALAGRLRGLGFTDVEVPAPGDRVRVG